MTDKQKKIFLCDPTGREIVGPYDEDEFTAMEHGKAYVRRETGQHDIYRVLARDYVEARNALRVHLAGKKLLRSRA